MGFRNLHTETAMRDQQRLEDIFGTYLFDKKNAVKTQTFRPVGPVIAYEYYWFDIFSKKAGKVVSIPKLCIDLDPYTDTYITDDCPFRASGQGRQSRIYLTNVIWRKEQANEPKHVPEPTSFEKKLRVVIGKTPDYPKGWEAYQLQPGSESWTPVMVKMFTANNAAKIAAYSEENIVKGKARDISDVDYGFDFTFKYDPQGTGTGKYAYDRKEGETPLTDDEMDYFVHKLDVLKFQTPKDAENDMKGLKKILASDDQKEEKKADGSRGKRSASRLDDDEEDNARQTKRNKNDDEDDDDDDKPSRNSSRERSRGRDEDDDDDDRSSRNKKVGKAMGKKSFSRSRRDDNIPF